MNFIHRKLDNGLEIVVELNDNAYSLAVGFFVRTGSRDETDDISGVSHFLEHMLFKGSERRTAEEVNRRLDEMGGRANAFTSEETTVYYAIVLPELQEDVIDLLGDIMRPAFRESDFNVEKKVILEEINMYADQPPFGIDEQSRRLFFGSHPLSRSVLGTPESVGSLTPGAMREYFQRRYSPNNMVVVATGKVDVDALERQLASITRHWEPASCERESIIPRGSRGKHLFVRENATQEYVYQLCDAPSTKDVGRYPSALLANVIGDDVGSRLFWALLDSGRADVAAWAYSDYMDAGCFISMLSCSPDKAAENLDIMQTLIEQTQREGIEEEELQRARNKLMARTVLSGERPRGRLFSVGMEWVLNRQYSSVQDDLAIIRGITCDDVHRVLEAYPIDRTLLVAIGPLEEIETKYHN